MKAIEEICFIIVEICFISHVRPTKEETIKQQKKKKKIEVDAKRILN